MPNMIELFKACIPLLDEVYKLASLTSVLDGAPELAKQGANANELIIPKIDMSGLANYSRNDGYVRGDVTFTNETVMCNFDRGRMFSVDVLDDLETVRLAYGKLASEFIRTKVVPELDAFRLAKYAAKAGGKATGALSTGAAVIGALRAAITEMDEKEVPATERYLYITPTLHGLIEDLDTTKSKQVLSGFAGVIKTPQSRFYTEITQRDGKSEGQEAGGYAKAEGGKSVNFLIVHKPAVIQYQKHVAPKVITPEANQSSDGYLVGYRNVGIADAYENKLDGIYAHDAG